MTSEICEDCGNKEEDHPIWRLTGLAGNTRVLCKKFKPQNHSHPENTSDLVEASKSLGDTEPEEASPRKASGSGNNFLFAPNDSPKDGSLSDENVKEKVKEMFFPDGSLSECIFELADDTLVILKKDVKEAVKKLKDEFGHRIFFTQLSHLNPWFNEIVDKIFGEALV